MIDKSTNGLMKGKRGIIFGLANNHSLAYGIAELLSFHGAEIALSYQNDILAKRVKPLGEQLGSDIFIECDVSVEGSVKGAIEKLSKKWDSIDFVVHSLAFSDKKELSGQYMNCSRENFLNSMLISVYSFTEICKEACPLMKNGGSFLTLTYYGAEKVIPNYNVMGVAKSALECSVKYLAVDLGCKNIRVNAISSGPIKTLAASGIEDFRYILKWNEYNSPLKRNTTIKDVGGAGIYLLSDLSSGVTGEIHHVDSGYNIIGMKCVDAPDISKI